jgi:hypothetical protein
MTNRILVGAVFLVGCAVGGASSQLVVPKASAQQAATLTRWEHFCDGRGKLSGATDDANQLGTQGWELVALSDTGWCFKRPKM